MSERICILCGLLIDENEETCIVKEKGAEDINKCSKQRGLDLVVESGTELLVKCRKRFTDQKDIQRCKNATNKSSAIKRKSDRISTDGLNERNLCLFCNTEIQFENASKNSIFEGVQVKTSEFAKTIKACCIEQEDDWGFIVLGRMEIKMSDLQAADCVYHRSCCVNFRTGKKIPIRYVKNFEDDTACKRNKGGRPEKIEQCEAFEKTCKYFETHDSEQFTISELVKIMESFLESSTEIVYSSKYFKQKLIEYFGSDSIVISSEDGKIDIVTLKTSADSILRKYYQTPKDVDIHRQKYLLLTAASKLIKTDIKSIINDTDQYPSLDKIDIDDAVSFLPSSLYMFLHSLIVQENN